MKAIKAAAASKNENTVKAAVAAAKAEAEKPEEEEQLRQETEASEQEGTRTGRKGIEQVQGLGRGELLSKQETHDTRQQGSQTADVPAAYVAHGVHLCCCHSLHLDSCRCLHCILFL